MTTREDGRLPPAHDELPARDADPTAPHARGEPTPATGERADADLRRAEKLEVLGSLTESVAREFDGALHAMTSHTALAQRCLSPDHPAQSFLDEVLRAGERASSMVRRIQKFSGPAATNGAAAEPPSGIHDASAVRGEIPPHVLFVDDEDVLVLLGTNMLQVLGYRATGVSLPLEALRTFADSPLDFDVVVTDLSMPGLSGFQLAQQLLALRADVPIVMMSGSVGAAELVHARRIGVRELLPKPVSMQELDRALSRVLGVSSRRRSSIHKS